MSFGSQGILALYPGFVEKMKTGDIYTYGTNSLGQILTKRILSTPSFRTMYSQMMQQLLSKYYQVNSGSVFVNRLSMMHDSLTPLAQQDYWHRLDLGYSYQNFLTNLQFAPVIHPTYINTTLPPVPTLYSATILPWATSRIDSAQNQLNQQD